MPDGPFGQGVMRSLSPARLAAYRLAEGEDTGALFGRYLWNVALAEALSPSLHFLEIALRNRLDEAIGGIAGPAWFDNANVVVDVRDQRHVAEAKEQLASDGRPPDRDRVVAELPFGFWVGLLSRQYEGGPDRPPTQIPLWPRLTPLIAPAGGRGLRVRGVLAQQFGGFRILRNRTYHHEPIWRGRRTQRGELVPLSVDHSNIVRLTHAMCPELGVALDLFDRFDDLYDRGPDTFMRAAGRTLRGLSRLAMLLDVVPRHPVSCGRALPFLRAPRHQRRRLA